MAPTECLWANLGEDYLLLLLLQLSQMEEDEEEQEDEAEAEASLQQLLLDEDTEEAIEEEGDPFMGWVGMDGGRT